tara:strand:+ start:161 stop:448 length:288 start_codon:yes stop_codon:yes gene_type:complete
MIFLNKIKYRWGIESNLQLIIIFIVFGITGSTSLLISGPILNFINLEQSITVNWIYWLVRIITIFPIYQILLLVIGTLFGEFEFFKNYTKKIFRI